MTRKKFALVGEISDFDYHGNWGDFVSPRSVKAFLNTLGAEDVAEIEINSPGGSIINGVEIANAIKNCPAMVVAHVTGIAASMASVIACACDEIELEEASFVMIHDPWSYAEGNAAEFRKQAALLDQMKAVIMSFYRGKFAGKSEDEIAALMSDETWYTAAECAANGIVCTVIASDVRAAASATGHHFTKAPAGALAFMAAKVLTDEGKAEIAAARESARAAAVAADTTVATPDTAAPQASADSHGAGPAAQAQEPPTPPPLPSNTQSSVSSPADDTKNPSDWEARYKGASKTINRLQAQLADVADTAKQREAALQAKLDEAILQTVDYGAACAARDEAQKALDDFNDQVKESGFENLAALVGAVSGLKTDLEKSEQTLADVRQQLAHMTQTRDLLTGGVLSAESADTYVAKMAAARTPEEREQLRAAKRAGRIN